MAKDSICVKYATGFATTVGYTSVFTPSTMFNKEGEYNISVLLSKAEGEKIQGMIKDITEKQYEQYRKNKKKADITACVPFVKVEKDENGRIIKETPDPEGRYILKAKNKAYIKDGKIGQKIQVVDSKLNPVSEIKFGEGTKVRLGLTLEGYSSNLGTGVSIKLRLVQLIEVKSYGGYKADDFFNVEDGYEFSEEEARAEAIEEDEEADF